MNALRKLVLGETRAVPAGVAVVLICALVLRTTGWWQDAGGFVLLAGVAAVLTASLRLP